MERGHRQIDHTADLCIEAYGPDEAAVLAEGARAIVEWISEEAAIDGDARRPLRIDGALDPGDRLVRFLNEVLHAAQLEGFLTRDAEIVLRGEESLTATLIGEDGARAKVTQELKSVTYHDLRLERSEAGGVIARFVVDV